MADIELVIKIDEELYKTYKSRPPMLGDAGIDTIAQSIANGTPLPKGHGRLIDVNEIPIDCDYYDVENAPTIIEADVPKIRKGTPIDENDSGYSCENWIP